MNINWINDQIERYGTSMQRLNRAQASHVKELSQTTEFIFKEWYRLMGDVNHSYQDYRQMVESDYTRRKKNLAQERYIMENRMFAKRVENMTSLSEKYQFLKETLHEERKVFKQVINEVNAQAGEFSHIWGGFVEKMAIESATNLLQKQYEANTFYCKVRKTIASDDTSKRLQLELDLLAESDDTVFLVEAKSTLRQESLNQLKTILERFATFFPQYSGKKIQPIFACLSAEEGLAEQALEAGIWLLIPIDEQDENSPKIEFDLVTSVNDL